MDDCKIIELFERRDEGAIVECQKQYSKLCTAIALHILGNPEDAEECVNDTWVKAWHAMPPKRPNNLKTFLGKITRHLSIDRYRTLHSSKRNIDLEVAMDELGDAIPMPDDTDENLLCGLLDEFLRGIPRTDCRLFLGRYWYGHSVATLAGHYGMSANTVSQHLYQTRQKLKAFLGERGYSV